MGHVFAGILLLAGSASTSAFLQSFGLIRYWTTCYNLCWSLSLFFILWSNRKKEYKDWILINSIYQFILNSNQVSGLPTLGTIALYESGLYISLILEVILLVHFYLPAEAWIKKHLFVKLEKIEFNIPSTADFEDKNKENNVNKSLEESSEWNPPPNPFNEKKVSVKQEPVLKVEEPKINDENKVTIGLEAVSGESLFDVEKIDIQLNTEDKDKVEAIIKGKGEQGVLFKELLEQSHLTEERLKSIVRYLEFEDRIIFSEKTDSDIKYVYL